MEPSYIKDQQILLSGESTDQSTDQSANKSTSESANQQNLLELLKKQGQIWRASNIDSLSPTASSALTNAKKPTNIEGISTGYETLNRLMANNGWPARGLTEILYDHNGLGELRLLIPALKHLSQHQNRWIVLVSPPYIPYAPALSLAGIDLRRLLIVNPKASNDQLWVLEKALHSHSCSAVMAWPSNIQYKQLKRLQVASKSGGCMGVLYRSARDANQPSPAELRVQLLAHQDNSAISDRSVINLKILKRKGGWATEVFPLELNDELNQSTPDFSDLPIQQWHNDQAELAHMDQHQDQYVLQ